MAIGLLILSSSLAAKADCDWTTEMFEKKPSDACQKELEGKAMNEQDKVYVRRMFKEWEPLAKTTDVYNEGGLIQLTDEKEQYLFQMQWMSQDPAVAWINGVIVTDKSTDTSVYRRIERMMDAAEQKTPSTAMMNPFMKLLGLDEAQAARRNNAQTAAFVYTLSNGFTGTATEILTGEGDGSKLALPERSWSSYLFGGGREAYQCNGSNKLAPMDLNIDGKTMRVTPTSRTTFVIKNMVDGQDVKVNMHGRRMYPKELVDFRKNKEGRRYAVISTACQGRYSPSLEQSCKDRWQEWADKHDEVKAHITAAGPNAKFGKDIKCGDVYSGKDKADLRKKCLAFFNAAFPRAGLRFHEGTASFSMCSDKNGKSVCGKAGDGSDVVMSRNPALRDENRAVNLGYAAAVRKQYREALQAAGYADVDSFCKVPELDTTQCFGMEGCIAQGADPKLEKCALPRPLPKDKSVAANLKALAQSANNPNRVEVKGATSDLKAKVETRLMGLMMLGDCCGDPTCSQKIFSSRKIDLKGSSQGPVAPARQ